MPNNHSDKDARVAALLGLAFDADDDQKRITRGKNFFLMGGSEDTHDQMRDTVVKVTDRLQDERRALADVSVEELRELFREAQADRD